MKKLLITICARGGSKGIPGKNIKPINGQELIGYTINHANLFADKLKSDFNIECNIEISTDDEEIKNVGKKFGLKNNYLRPEFLANDTAGKLDAIKDVLLFSEKENVVNYDYILDLDVSAPMRTIEDLSEALTTFLKNEDASCLFSVSNANKNPYFNMVEQDSDGFYTLSKKSEMVLSRQAAPAVYEMNASFYFYRRSFYNQQKLYLFKNALIFKMNHESFDLDHIIDFDFLEYMIINNKLTFNI